MTSSEPPIKAPANLTPSDPVAGSHEQHDEVDAERDSPPSVRILVMIAILTIVVVISVIGVWQLVVVTSDTEVQNKELAPDNPVLAELRARDHGMLQRYEALDRGAGRYQIPIERAMDLLVHNPELIAPRPSASGSAAAPHSAHPAPGWAHAPAASGSVAPAGAGSAPAPGPSHSGGH